MENDNTIDLPKTIQNLWSSFDNWKVEISLSVQGNRVVYRALYEEYKDVRDLEDVFKKLLDENDETLMNYRFFCTNIIPLFSIYADGKLFSRSSPRKFYNRDSVQGARPWEYESDDTVFSLGRCQKNKYFGQQHIRLRCGGRSKVNALTNWKQLRQQIVDFTKKLIPQV